MRSAETEILVATPYIKTTEARWVCRTVMGSHRKGTPKIRVLTDLRSDSVLSGALDVEALMTFCDFGPGGAVITLPRLHSKVYLADAKAAIVGSANLTPAGLEQNFEYGVRFRDEAIARKIRADLEAYARVGSVLDARVLGELTHVAEELKRKYTEVQRSSHSRLRKRFDQTLEKANFEFLRAQVGNRSAHGLFAEAILYVLTSMGPLETRRLAPEIQKLLPELCDNTVELVINGERFGKRWKHDVRNAQQALKKRGLVMFDGKRWAVREGAEEQGPIG